MRCRQIMATVAGLAALAGPLGQQARAQMAPNGWIITVQDPILGPVGSGLPQMTTIEVRAKFDSAVDYAFAAGLFDFVASEEGAWSNNELIGPFDFSGTSPGISGPTGATGVTPGQLHFPVASIRGDPSNPALVWSIKYTATEFTPRFIDLDTVTDPGPKGFHLYTDIDRSQSRQVDLSMLMEGSGRFQIIPAPGSIACVGLAWLVIGRRRR